MLVVEDGQTSRFLIAVDGVVVGKVEFGDPRLEGFCSCVCVGFCKISSPSVAATASEKDCEEQEENCHWKYC